MLKTVVALLVMLVSVCCHKYGIVECVSYHSILPDIALLAIVIHSKSPRLDLLV